MTPTPPSTGRSPESQFRVVRKRNRVPLSCHPCRTRKKCDRFHPCSNCTKREGADTLSCSYATPVSRRKNQDQGAHSPDDMQNRIDRLEGLVLSLMHGGATIDTSSSSAGVASSSGGTASNTSPSAADSNSLLAKADGQDEGVMHDGDESDIDEDLANSLGVLKVDPDRTKHIYIGQEHWHTILLDIVEVKNYFANHKKDLEKSFEKIGLAKPPTAKQPPILLMGAAPASEIELRAELPPKSTVLALCERYFNSIDNAVSLIHAPAFYQQLRNHWQDPSKTPIMWLAVLYSVLCLAMLSYLKVGDEPPEGKGRALELADEYRLRTVQCLIAGDFTKPTEYTVEAIMLYSFGEYSTRWDADLGVWMIISMAVRIAFRMGYHRDPKWFSTLTPFQAEMRRRIWATVRMMDVLFSHHVSLPNMISDQDCDTELPQNILDDEFGPDSKVLPPSRPITEPTPISYMIFKVRLCQELGSILQATGRVKNQVHYDEILRFDAKLRDIHADIPPHLRMQPLGAPHEPCQKIITRFSLAILYLKVVCLLHRKYVPRARHNPRYAHSRRSAIEASLEMLRHLATLHRESQPGGRLHSVKWYVTSVATKDFLLPAMLVALDLHFDKAAQRSEDRQGSQNLQFWTQEQHEEMVNSLELTKGIWNGLSDTSMEALKASKALEIMLAKIKSPADSGVVGAASSAELRPGHSAAMTLGMLSNGMMPDAPAAFNSARDLGGTMYPGFDPTLDTAGTGFGLGTSTSTGAVLASDFPSVVPGLDGGQSPLAMFGNMTGGGMDLTSDFDWVSFENYTQTAHWGGESFQFFSGNTDQSQQQSSQDSPTFTYGSDLAGAS
ncbi:Activator of stress genes 1 [Madurella mycetomatis]|uniref:Activator of stress genes 1 n=1 Tax=Madurella mycetomatis TaxID=100816 RepID=A0A175W7K1_9PEZI|nr:Activator of stress genes 1 [Madurella mycetomatis]